MVRFENDAITDGFSTVLALESIPLKNSEPYPYCHFGTSHNGLTKHGIPPLFHNHHKFNSIRNYRPC